MMKDYVNLNKERWNQVKNDYTEPFTHEEIEKRKDKPICVSLTVGKLVPESWFEKTKGKKFWDQLVVEDNKVNRLH